MTHFIRYTLLFFFATGFGARANEEEFRPFMIDHENKGCPINSACTKESGLILDKWSNTLKNSHKGKLKTLNQFLTKNGIPYEVFTSSKAKKEDGLIIWDSPCREHNKDGEEKIGIALALVKNLREIKKLRGEDKVYPRLLKLYRDEKKEPVSFMAVRGENPLYLDNNDLVYKKSYEGSYYGLKVASNGNLSIVETIKPREYPSSIACPEKLIEETKKETFPKNLYAEVYCQKLWNKADNSFGIVMVGWSCN